MVVITLVAWAWGSLLGWISKLESVLKRPATDAAYEASECVVCMDGSPYHTFRPCKHKACCKDCSLKLNKCPLCRCEINERACWRLFSQAGQQTPFNSAFNVKKLMFTKTDRQDFRCTSKILFSIFLSTTVRKEKQKRQAPSWRRNNGLKNLKQTEEWQIYAFATKPDTLVMQNNCRSRLCINCFSKKIFFPHFALYLAYQ